MSEKPVMHGRDHRPGGEDPIPGLSGGGLKWAFQASPAHVTVGTASNVVIAPTTASGFFTNDTTTFTQGTAVDSSTTYYGIKLLATTGLYLTTATLSPFTAIASGIDYEVNVANGNDPDESGLFTFPIRRIALSSESVDAQTLSWQSLGTLIGSAPTGAMLFKAVNHNSVGSYSAFISVLCLQLDAAQSTYVG